MESGLNEWRAGADPPRMLRGRPYCLIGGHIPSGGRNIAQEGAVGSGMQVDLSPGNPKRCRFRTHPSPCWRRMDRALLAAGIGSSVMGRLWRIRERRLDSADVHTQAPIAKRVDGLSRRCEGCVRSLTPLVFVRRRRQRFSGGASRVSRPTQNPTKPCSTTPSVFGSASRCWVSWIVFGRGE